MSSVRSVTFFLVLIAASFVSCVNAQSPENQVSLSGTTMGTTWSVKAITTGDAAVPDEGLLTDELTAVNAAMSTWDPDSEISRFNSSQSTDWFDVSVRTIKVVCEAIRILKCQTEPSIRPWGL